MKRLFTFAEDYISTISVMEFGAFKVCLLCFGLLLGISVKSTHRRSVRTVAAVGFFATLIPLMARFFSTMLDWFDYSHCIPVSEEPEPMID